MSGLTSGASRARARRYATLAAGWGLVVTGGVLLFLPGPGLAIILVGLAVLGREAPWAQQLDHRIRARLRLRRARIHKPAATPVSCATPVPVSRRDVRR